MEGDTFEMEDQRNWTDASYKTYVRPLALPWPYTLRAGEQHQPARRADGGVELRRAASRRADVRHPSVARADRPLAVPPLGFGLDPKDAAGDAASRGPR